MTKKDERIAKVMKETKPHRSVTVGERLLWVKILHGIIKAAGLSGADMVRFIRLSGGER